jgi:NAD(P)-dependent dehydrogenase (short-subunit alcohol dehydrogenase family)
MGGWQSQTVPVPDLTDRPLPELISLDGKRAVVTGAARGLGAAIASRLAEAGASVMLADLDDVTARATADRITERFAGATAATSLDVADSGSIAAAADLTVKAFGGIDIWVNNAGIYPFTPLLDMADDDWDRVLDINLRGAFIGCREAARQMIPAGRGGVIVNLASIAGIRGRRAGVAHYVASKHGVIGVTRQVALELAPHAIRVLAVAPTTIITPGVQGSVVGNVDLEESLMTPLGRAGQPDDVARVVLFCASDLSMFMTGSTLLVDAGEMAQ